MKSYLIWLCEYLLGIGGLMSRGTLFIRGSGIEMEKKGWEMRDCLEL